jgi:DNA-binding SARP family transcriptional activator
MEEHFGSMFFPKIKQLFVLIAIYTVDKNGISPSEINELLWNDVSNEKATNARGTSIQKIRTILKNFEGIRIELIDKSWQLVTNCYFDYKEFSILHIKLKQELKIKQVNKSTLNEFIELINNKAFLTTINTEWMDEMKANVTERIMNILLDAYSLFNDDYDLSLDIADALFTFDDLNEEALEIKIRVYQKQGKTKLAQSVYSNFTLKYMEIMKTPFNQNFEQFSLHN